MLDTAEFEFHFPLLTSLWQIWSWYSFTWRYEYRRKRSTCEGSNCRTLWGMSSDGNSVWSSSWKKHKIVEICSLLERENLHGVHKIRLTTKVFRVLSNFSQVRSAKSLRFLSSWMRAADSFIAAADWSILLLLVSIRSLGPSILLSMTFSRSP